MGVRSPSRTTASRECSLMISRAAAEPIPGGARPLAPGICRPYLGISEPGINIFPGEGRSPGPGTPKIGGRETMMAHRSGRAARPAGGPWISGTSGKGNQGDRPQGQHRHGHGRGRPARRAHRGQVGGGGDHQDRGDLASPAPSASSPAPRPCSGREGPASAGTPPFLV